MLKIYADNPLDIEKQEPPRTFEAVFALGQALS